MMIFTDIICYRRLYAFDVGSQVPMDSEMSIIKILIFCANPILSDFYKSLEGVIWYFIVFFS